MSGKPLLIVGIDPGTTTAFALLDVNCNVLRLSSAKELSIDDIISEITRIGSPVCVGCDKAKVPAFVEKFAVQVGAKLFSPSEDLRVGEKRKITSSLFFRNNHEMDALASAIFAFNRVEGLFRRVDKFLASRKKSILSDEVKELVVKKGMSISGALDYLSAPEKQEARIIKKVVEEKKLNEKDFLELYHKLKSVEQDNILLKGQNRNLEGRLKAITLQSAKRIHVPEANHSEKADNRIKLKDRNICFLNKQLSEKDKQILAKEKDIQELNSIISGISSKIVVKKLRNLGWSEFQARKSMIQKGDVLLVDDPSEFSQKTLEELKGFVDIIIHRKCIPRKFLDSGFVFVNACDLGAFSETGFFAFVNKGSFEEARRNRDLLKNIIKAYKSERLT